MLTTMLVTSTEGNNVLLWKENVPTSIWNFYEHITIEDVIIYGSLLAFFTIFILPFFGSIAFAFSIYFSEVILWWFTRKIKMNSGYSKVDNQQGKNAVIMLYDWIGWLWHGYKIEGLENLPNGGAILVSFNGPLAIDRIYLMMKLNKQDLPSYSGTIRNNKASRIGRGRFNRVFNLAPFTVDECCNHLKDGGYLSVMPGGFEESRFGDGEYQTNFRGRHNFAEVALNTEVPIIPIFTKNIQEAFWIPWFLKPFVSGMCAPKNIPILPVAGGLPVKLTTYIGKPIDYDLTLSAEELADKVCLELQALIDEHQDVPGSIFRALFDRLERKKKDIIKTQDIDNIDASDNSVVDMTVY